MATLFDVQNFHLQFCCEVSDSFFVGVDFGVSVTDLLKYLFTIASSAAFGAVYHFASLNTTSWEQ